MIVFVDVDDVLADLTTVWLARYNADYSDSLAPAMISDWKGEGMGRRGEVCQGDSMSGELTIKDSGERSQYPTGAQRDNAEGKGRFDLLSVPGVFRLARWYELGAKKYADRNWEKGMNISRCMDAALRHTFKYLWGCNDEDHLAAAVWNLMSIMFYESELPECQDLPGWQGRENKWIFHLDQN